MPKYFQVTDEKYPNKHIIVLKVVQNTTHQLFHVTKPAN